MLRFPQGADSVPKSGLQGRQKEAYLVMEGDYGGQIFLVCPRRMVACTRRVLKALLRELDRIAWGPIQAGDYRYEALAREDGVHGGMGGGKATGDLWLHAEFRYLALYDEILAILTGQREQVDLTLKGRPIPSVPSVLLDIREPEVARAWGVQHVFLRRMIRRISPSGDPHLVAITYLDHPIPWRRQKLQVVSLRAKEPNEDILDLNEGRWLAVHLDREPDWILEAPPEDNRIRTGEECFEAGWGLAKPPTEGELRTWVSSSGPT